MGWLVEVEVEVEQEFGSGWMDGFGGLDGGWEAGEWGVEGECLLSYISQKMFTYQDSVSPGCGFGLQVILIGKAGDRNEKI